MNETEEVLSPEYVAGLLDATGRVQFNIHSQTDNKFTVRPSLRIRTYESTARRDVLGMFLDSQSYDSTRFVDGDYSISYFLLDQHSELQQLEEYLAGHSAQLANELAFVTSLSDNQFGGQLLTAEDVYQLLITRDELRHGWRPRGRNHTTPQDFSDEYDVRPSKVDSLPLPDGRCRSGYSEKWFAGLFDGICRYRASIAQTDEVRIGYTMYPIARMHLTGVSKQLVDYALDYCESTGIDYGSSSTRHDFQVYFTAHQNVRKIIETLLPHSIVLRQHSELMLESILPRFEEGVHTTKTGFYELLCDCLYVGDRTGGPFRKREYNPSYFEEIWSDEFSLQENRDEDTKTRQRTDPFPREDFDPVQVEPELYEDIGRYQTVLDRVRRDREIVNELKGLYDDKCQVCGTTLLRNDGTRYSEVHHIVPLGEPHSGPDKRSNMLVLCPNHHTDFDNGVVSVSPESLELEHTHTSALSDRQLAVDSDHHISTELLRYHNEKIVGEQ
ncbi:HNH endonuclease [Haloferax chudinovii]|uniref:HNH endonuclease n=1 Tax=Haloferax chudinovii TaxID=1109010 RepID=A0ABD5XDR0_9EURY